MPRYTLFHILSTLLLSFHVLAATIPATSSLTLDSPLDSITTSMLAIGDLPLTTDFGSANPGGNNTLAAGKETTNCIKKPKYTPDKYRADFTDCALALRLFPSTVDSKSFCSTPDPSCRLPAGSSAGKCKVIVSLVAGAKTETSSWAEIGLGGLELLDACLDNSKSAGSTVVGENDKIQITVTKERD